MLQDGEVMPAHTCDSLTTPVRMSESTSMAASLPNPDPSKKGAIQNSGRPRSMRSDASSSAPAAVMSWLTLIGCSFSLDEIRKLEARIVMMIAAAIREAMRNRRFGRFIVWCGKKRALFIHPSSMMDLCLDPANHRSQAKDRAR